MNEAKSGLSRRHLLGTGAAGIAVAAAGGVTGYALAESGDSTTGNLGEAVGFWAEDNNGHQAGIVTPAQDRLHFVSFDITTGDRDALVALLRRWTQAAARMTDGKKLVKSPPGMVR